MRSKETNLAFVSVSYNSGLLLDAGGESGIAAGDSRCRRRRRRHHRRRSQPRRLRPSTSSACSPCGPGASSTIEMSRLEHLVFKFLSSVHLMNLSAKSI